MIETGQTGVDVVIEDDATPFVRSVARAVGSALRHGVVPTIASSESQRAVVISANGDPQSASLVLTPGRIDISHGALPTATATAVVDVYDLGVDVAASTGDRDLIDTVVALVGPSSRSDWKSAAAEFWSHTGETPGMPQQMVFEVSVTGDRVVLGEGLPAYRIVADEDVLSRLCTGTIGLLEALGAGDVAIQGTLPQLSVMTGAFNKMRFDV